MGKGWERASIEFHTRPNRIKRNVSRRDLLLPSGTGWGLFGECMACGVLFALALWFPLAIISLLMGGSQPWFWWTLCGAAVGFGPLLFAYATRDLTDFIRSLEEG